MIQNQQESREFPIKPTNRYHAFISYAHEDKKTVEWLCRLLSTFWVPWKGKRRIFLDQESLRAGGGLSATLTDALKQSRFLIVCCSKDSAQSHWVDLEVNEFLESHPAENVLACLVGPKSAGPFAVPQAIRSVQQKLGDELFKPDLRSSPENLRGRERQAATKEALALLAPLVGLPGKDELLDQRKKTLIVGTVFLLVLVSAATGWKIWDNRPESQINKILSASPDLVKAITTDFISPKSASPKAEAISNPAEDRHDAIGEWLRTLVLVGHPTVAMKTALRIDRAGPRSHALIQVADQLGEGGAIHHFIDHWGRPSWESVPVPLEGRAEIGVSDQARQAANEAVDAANEVLEAARKIEDAQSRFELMIKITDALGRVGKNVEAKLVAHEALETGRKIEDPSSRSGALVRIVEALAKTRQNDEATQIAAEALQAARNIKDKKSRSGALMQVATALAEAGKTSEAQATAREIDDTRAQSQGLVSIVDVLVKSGLYADARAAAQQISSADSRAKALVGIAEGLVKAGQSDEAKQVGNEALEAARQFKFDLEGRYTTHAWVVEMLVRTGRTDEALEIVRQTHSAEDRSRTLVAVMETLVKGDKPDEATRVANEAVESARQIDKADARAGALIAIAKALPNSGSNSAVSRIVNEALAAMGNNGGYWGMDEIVRLLLKAGETQDAKQVAYKELAAIQQLPSEKQRTDALANSVLLTVVARSGTSAETRHLAHIVLEAAQQRKFEWEANRTWFLVDIVAGLAQAGKSDEAMEAAGEIANQVIRIRALIRVAEELAKAHEATKAKAVIDEARRLALQLNRITENTFPLADLAKGLARLHYFRLAREAVESQPPSDKLAVYIVILREYSIERNPSLAKLFEEERPE